MDSRGSENPQVSDHPNNYFNYGIAFQFKAFRSGAELIRGPRS